jgi:hypothetical protein
MLATTGTQTTDASISTDVNSSRDARNSTVLTPNKHLVSFCGNSGKTRLYDKNVADNKKKKSTKCLLLTDRFQSV